MDATRSPSADPMIRSRECREDLRRRDGRRPGAGSGDPARRAGLPGRTVGLRQVDDAEDDQPADRADHRHDRDRRRRRHPPGPGRAAPQHRLRDPAGRALPAPEDPRQRDDRAAAVRRVEVDRPRAGPRAARPGRSRPGDVRRPLPPPALRRPAAAGRGGARAGREPAGAADGRAVRRGRPGGADCGCRTSSSGCRTSSA